MPKVSRFWAAGGRRTLTNEWQERDAELRREYWRGQQPSEFISFRIWKKMPARRRQAIEQVARAAHERDA